MNEQRYPLYWPSYVPRCKYRKRAAFRGNGGRGQKSMDEATGALERELERINASGIVLSTSLELRLDGGLRSSRGVYVDPGAAVYFTRNKQRICMPCDRWDRVEDNVYAIAMHVEAMRGMERWGVGTVEQAFAGYKALNEGEKWWDVLECDRDASRPDVLAQYHRLARTAHPDTGGSHDAMVRLNAAFEEAQAELIQARRA